jgi:hypothetical protein
MKTSGTVCALAAATFALIASAASGAESVRGNTGVVPGVPGHDLAGFKLKCMGYALDEVIFSNFGDGPVPAGTVVDWQTAKTNVEPKARNGSFLFRQPLVPNASVGINWPPPPSPQGQSSGDGLQQAVETPLALEFMEPCTLTIRPGLANVPQLAPRQPIVPRQ